MPSLKLFARLPRHVLVLDQPSGLFGVQTVRLVGEKVERKKYRRVSTPDRPEGSWGSKNAPAPSPLTLHQPLPNPLGHPNAIFA